MCQQSLPSGETGTIKENLYQTGEHFPVHSGICWAHIKEYAGNKKELGELPVSRELPVSSELHVSSELPNDHETIKKVAGLKRKRSQAW